MDKEPQKSPTDEPLARQVARGVADKLFGKQPNPQNVDQAVQREEPQSFQINGPKDPKYVAKSVTKAVMIFCIVILAIFFGIIVWFLNGIGERGLG